MNMKTIQIKKAFSIIFLAFDLCFLIPISIFMFYDSELISIALVFLAFTLANIAILVDYFRILSKFEKDIFVEKSEIQLLRGSTSKKVREIDRLLAEDIKAKEEAKLESKQ